MSLNNEDNKRGTHDFARRLTPIINSLELSDTEKYIIKNRFVNEVVYYNTKADRTKKTYNGFRFLVTGGSLLIPALMSIQQIEGTSQTFKDNIYWTTWSLSLAVTTCNGFIQLFSLDKNYFTFSIIMEKLKTEGWQFLQLSGKYDSFKNHKKAYKTFCNNIETLKIKQVMSEFTSGKASKKEKEKKKKEDTDSDEDEDNNPKFNKEFNKEFMDNMNRTMNTPALVNPNDMIGRLVGGALENGKEELHNQINSKINSKIDSKINDNINSTLASEREDIENKLMDNIDGFSNVITTITDNINASKSTTNP